MQDKFGLKKYSPKGCSTDFNGDTKKYSLGKITISIEDKKALPLASKYRNLFYASEDCLILKVQAYAAAVIS